MPKASRFMGGKFLNVERVDKIPEAERKTTIDHISIESINGKDKPVMYFTGIDEGFPLGTENLEECIDMFKTEEMDEWRGKPIEVWVDPSVRYQGQRVGGVRLRAPK